MHLVETRFGDVVRTGTHASGVIHNEIAALEVANREERFTRLRIRHGFQILNRTAQQRIGRTGNQTIAPDVIPVAVFQLLQFCGGVGVHHPYGVLAVFGFQLVQQVDQAIRGNVSGFHLLQRAERTGFISSGRARVRQEPFGFFITVAVHKVAFFGSGEGVSDFRRQPAQDIHLGEVENLLGGFRVGVDRVEFDINTLHPRRAGFGTWFTFGAAINGSAAHRYQLLVFVGFGGLHRCDGAHHAIILQLAHNLFVQLRDNGIAAVSLHQSGERAGITGHDVVAQLVVAYWLAFNGSTRQIALIVGDGFKTGDFNFEGISLGAEFIELFALFFVQAALFGVGFVKHGAHLGFECCFLLA
ncbi:Uncharacterised protein [Enterobacter hormaechei]|nr:Uncharacterised protein [Enterobacter hormaechei]SAA86432.1 Uncharacterised protein [Enterobacter hormaechei]SAE11486.1 Uncharacterised protein [Enterobacter hormaechei]